MLGNLFAETRLPVTAAELVVRYPRPETPEDKRYDYPRDLLKLALEKTEDTHGAFRIEDAKLVANQGRTRMVLLMSCSSAIIKR